MTVSSMTIFLSGRPVGYTYLGSLSASISQLFSFDICSKDHGVVLRFDAGVS